MLFTSYIFALFLPIVFTGYWLLNRHLRLQNLFVVIASYIFYGWWDWRFLILIFITSVWAWVSGLLLARQNVVLRRKIIVAVALVVNLGILGIFKYYNFFIGSVESLLSHFGFVCTISSLNIILPVGISFYTFQALSYVIDVYRKDIEPTVDPVAFLAFVSFFPQLVAGPIERATKLLPQFLYRRSFDYTKAVDGCRQMLWGFVKKTVVADNCAALVERIFESQVEPNGFAVAIGAFAFSLQIYGDFSGYSDIAIGCARLFGIDLQRNFAFPYFSRDIAEFWRRWHISLNTWFRDYLYIPLGGSRVCAWKKVRNIFAIFLVSGLWHGANWTFVLWGAFHATLFLPLMLLKANRKYLVDTPRSIGVSQAVRQFLGCVVTFLLVAFGWLIFRAPDLSTFWLWLSKLFSPSLFSAVHGYSITSVPWLIVTVVFLVEFLNRSMLHGLQRVPGPRVCRWISYLLLITAMVFYRGGQADFIYFQF